MSYNIASHKWYKKLLSRSGIPDETKTVPLGPFLSPGVRVEFTAKKFRAKLLLRVGAADIAESISYTSEPYKKQNNK